MKLAWKQIVIAGVVGACAGFAGAWSSAPYLIHRHGGGQFQHRLLDRFSSKLKLTAEQRSRVSAILDTKRQKIDALRAEIRPRFEELRTATSAEIRQLLTPEQQQKFDGMEAEWKRRRERFRSRWSGPDGTP